MLAKRLVHTLETLLALTDRQTETNIVLPAQLRATVLDLRRLEVRILFVLKCRSKWGDGCHSRLLGLFVGLLGLAH